MSASTTPLPAPTAIQLHHWFHNDEDWYDNFKNQAHAIRASVNCHNLPLFAELPRLVYSLRTFHGTYHVLSNRRLREDIVPY